MDALVAIGRANEGRKRKKPLPKPVKKRKAEEALEKEDASLPRAEAKAPEEPRTPKAKARPNEEREEEQLDIPKTDIWAIEGSSETEEDEEALLQHYRE